MGAGDAGGAPSLLVIGNNVVVGIRAVVLGPVRIGDRPQAAHRELIAMRLSILIVNWKVRDLLRECLRSALEEIGDRGHEIEIIVVDNDSRDCSVEMVRSEFPECGSSPMTATSVLVLRTIRDTRYREDVMYCS